MFCMNMFEPAYLTNEHIVPEAIHGTLVIENGSCCPCARHSNKAYENGAINGDLQLPRLLLELKGKGKGGSPKDIRHLPAVYAGDALDGDIRERLDFPVDLYPKMFNLVGFPAPGLLAGIDRGDVLNGLRLQIFNIGGRGLANVTVSQKFTNGPFAMTLAKIGYCYAVAEKGFEAFDGSDIRDLLIGQRSDVYNFVGSTEKPERLANRDLHGLYFRERGEWLTVLVHLFASCVERPIETLPYEVVVGKLR